MQRFRHPEVFRKADGTGVTDADRAAERVLVRGLREAWPEDAVVGEEGAAVRGSADTWYVDPIDGTHAFIEGLAHWGPTVGRVRAQGERHELLLGAAYFPRLDEFWFGAKGEGAWRDGRRLEPLAGQAPGRRSVLLVPSRFHRWFEIDFAGKARSLGSTAAHLCLVAGGGACAAFIPAGWSPWDVVGGLTLLVELGGVALSLDGAQVDPVADYSVPFIAGHPATVDALRAAMRFRPPRDPGA
ncbi:MAG: inositol monophosphatase [Alphaproteobacteria bacterium]|nr:inositol monophosphatase [Alphaproteobacteria bacterium]MCB9794723.1 inositol monophosphatase [Alphaproteobacteria bacterium]